LADLCLLDTDGRWVGGRAKFFHNSDTKPLQIGNGSDGTRTRDLRRDRPVLVVPG